MESLIDCLWFLLYALPFVLWIPVVGCGAGYVGFWLGAALARHSRLWQAAIARVVVFAIVWAAWKGHGTWILAHSSNDGSLMPGAFITFIGAPGALVVALFAVSLLEKRASRQPTGDG